MSADVNSRSPTTSYGRRESSGPTPLIPLADAEADRSVRW